MHVRNAAISSALLPGVIFTAAFLCKIPPSLPSETMLFACKLVRKYVQVNVDLYAARLCIQ